MPTRDRSLGLALDRTARRVVLAAGALVWIAFLGWRGPFFLLTGQFFPTRIVETLAGPVTVAGWNEAGLFAYDGTQIALPGVIRLPQDAELMHAITARGVEVAPNGRVFGLVEVDHWCGNDPVTEHIVRMDLARLLQFLGKGEHATTLPAEWHRPRSADAVWRWDMGDHIEFQAWEALVAFQQATTAPAGGRIP